MSFVAKNRSHPRLDTLKENVEKSVVGFTKLRQWSVKDILPEDPADAAVEFARLVEVLIDNSPLLRRIYKAYSAMGNVKDHIAVSSVEWKVFVQDLKIVGGNSFSLSKADIIFVKADVVEDLSKGAASAHKIDKTGDLSPIQFVEAVIRMVRVPD